MNRNKTILFGAMLALFCLVLAPATLPAAYITGSVNLGSPIANVVIPTMDTATFVGAPSFTVVTPGSGDLGASIGAPGTAIGIPGNGPLAGFLVFDGFTIDVTAFSGPTVWTITSLPNGTDFVSLGFNGVAKKAGFDDTPIIGAISAQYSGGYNSTQTVAWSGNVEVVPEPATLALVGLALVGAGLFQRRRQQQVV